MGGSSNEMYHDYSVDSEDQPTSFGDSLADDRGLVDPLEEGIAPPDRWSVGQGFGNTPAEERRGESLEQRLAQEEPDPDPYADDDSDVDEDGLPSLAGETRAGRLTDPEPGAGGDSAQDIVGRDVGIDGAGASAEEAAMHIIDPSEDWTQD